MSRSESSILKSIAEHFEELPDPRLEVNREHLLLVEGQKDEAVSATPFVAGLLEETPLAVGAFHVIVGANHGRAFSASLRRCASSRRGRRAEEDDLLVELSNLSPSRIVIAVANSEIAAYTPLVSRTARRQWAWCGDCWASNRRFTLSTKFRSVRNGGHADFFGRPRPRLRPRWPRRFRSRRSRFTASRTLLSYRHRGSTPGGELRNIWQQSQRARYSA